MKRIFIIGSSNTDMVVKTDELPLPGETKLGGIFFMNAGDAPIVKVMDTTAAGDTFSGAISVALTENMEWEEAVRFSKRAASISVTRMGAQSSVPYRTEMNV